MKKTLWILALSAALAFAMGAGNLLARDDGGPGDKEGRWDKGFGHPMDETKKEAPPAKSEKSKKNVKAILGEHKAAPQKAAPVPGGNTQPGGAFRPKRMESAPQAKPVGGSAGNAGGQGVRQGFQARGQEARDRNVKARALGADAGRRPSFLEHKPKPIENKKEFVFTPREKSIIQAPRRGPDGRSFEGRVVNTAPRGNRMMAVNNQTFVLNINNESHRELEHNRYYWHDRDGYRYCHYYDDWGYHWYGWYWGSDLFWTRYYCNRWWWYDRLFDRWCYWHDGYWWWQDPNRMDAVYVWNDGKYVSPEEDLRVPDGGGPLPPSDGAKKAFSDQTGSRLVKIFGASRDAFLYDTAEPPAFKPVYLDTGVKEAQFSYDDRGRTRQVVIYLNDGSVEVFDARGNAYQAPPNN